MAAPTVQTVEAEEVTNNQGIIKGYCWDDGGAEIPLFIFGWGTVENHDEWTDWTGWLTAEAGHYYAHLATGLDPDTVYFFEIIGADGELRDYGGYKSFRTQTAVPVGVAGHFWVEGDYWCYIDSAGYKRKIKGVG